MQQLVFFIQKYKYVLFFLLLQLIALTLTINNHNFHRSKFISSANSVTGNLFEKTANISNYLSLKEQNETLVSENQKLLNEIEKLKSTIQFDSEIKTTSTLSDTKFNYISSTIIRNEFSKPYNFLTINKGESDGISKEMGVVNSKGIIGITEETSSGYSRVQSILNNSSLINAKFLNSNHYGTLKWDGKDYNVVQLTDIPRQASYKVGDTIITGGKSSIFPEGILIGKVLEKLEANSSVNTINILLFNDMSNLKNAYVIKNFDKEEIKNLENK